MAFILANGRQQYFDSTGNPLAGGRLFTMQPGPGVTTPKNTWADAGETALNTNPIILDARGEAQVFWRGSYNVRIETAAGGLIYTVESIAGGDDSLRGDLANANSLTAGAGLVGYTYDELYGANTAGAKLRERISVKDFGAVGDGVADDTAALAAARTYLAANSTRVALRFPSGIYRYSVSPNWAITNAVIVAEGEVRLRYTGTGNAVILDAGVTDFVWNCHFGSQANPFLIEAPSTALNGVYARSYHHSSVWANVRGCGTLFAALNVAFSVVSVYGITASINEAPWYLGATPGNGMLLTQRAVGEKVAACTFFNPIIEGVSGDGIVLEFADKNLFLNGTSEGNPTGWGVVVAATSLFNNFDGIDLEGNGTGDVFDSGAGTSYNSVLSDSLFRTGGGSRLIKCNGGSFNNIQHDGVGLALNEVEYSSAGGAITGSGTGLSISGAQPSGGAIAEDRQPYSIHGSVSALNATPTTVITLPSSGTRNYIVTACINGAGAASSFNAWAMIGQDLGTSRILTQVNGSLLTMTLSGQNVQVTQSSGVTATVVVRANPA